MSDLLEAGEHPVRPHQRRTGPVKAHTRVLVSPEGNARAQALLGILTRARSRFDTRALAALNPDLTGRQEAAALRREQRYAREWEAKARQRIRKRLAVDPSEETALGMLPAERSTLANHLAVTGLRLAATADLAALRTGGDTHGYWLRSDRPWLESCQECQRRAGRLWPVDWLTVNGPPRHPNCGCKVIMPAAARSWGLTIDDPLPLTESASPTDRLPAATGQVLEQITRLQEAARDMGLSARGAELLAAVLREATIPVWREDDHPRWPTGSPLGGQFRRADINVPDALRPGLNELAAAARAGDEFGIERGYDQMVKAAKALPKTDRGDALRTAARARAGVFNPRGLRVPTGEQLDAVPIPLSIPAGGINHPWATDADGHPVFMWEVSPGELGPDHDRLVHSLRRAPQLVTTDIPGGGVRIHSARQRTTAQAVGDARRVEVLAPQLTATRVQAPGVDLADTRRIDLHPEESAARPRGWYPGVTPRMLADSARNLIDGAASRMTELGLADRGARHEPARSPLDWVIGDRAIVVVAQSMRSLTPGQQQRADTTYGARVRAQRLAYTAANGLRPALVHSVVDLDNDVAHLFLHDFPDADTAYKDIRPPTALIDRLVAGTLRPGDEDTAAHGPDAGRGAKRFVFLGTFRLGYNPLLARAGKPPDLEDARRRRGGKPPLDIGVRRPVAPPVDRETVAQVKQQGAQRARQARADREARDSRIVQLYADGEGLSQNELAAMFGLTQPTVSTILNRRGAKTRAFTRAKRPRRSAK